MKTPPQIKIRPLCENDLPIIAAAFLRIGWKKPESQYRRYLNEASAGKRTCLIANVVDDFAGYVTVNWQPTYPGSVEANTPEIQDLNVLPEFQRRGIATRLLDEVEALVARRSAVVAIGVGLHPGYNAAVRLYVKRGYVPDGRGVTYRDIYVKEGAQVVLDDNLVLHLVKQL